MDRAIRTKGMSSETKEKKRGREEREEGKEGEKKMRILLRRKKTE